MIVQIAKKEIQHNFYSIRFPALLVISVFLFALNAILAATEPLEETPSMPKPRVSTTRTSVIRQHNVLQFCVRDAGADRIRNMAVTIDGRIYPRTGRQYTYNQLPVNDYLGRYALPYADHVDWMFIVKMVFSLFAIIFTFDTICGERENGTLALMCANSVSRSFVLLGKYLGVCGTILIPLMVGAIINLLVIASGVAGTVPLQTEHWLRVSLLIITSVMYISLFVLLGMLVSTAMQRSSSSLLVLLAFWVALVIVHPNLAGITARNVSKVETIYQLRKKVDAVKRQSRDEFNERTKNRRIETQEDYKRIADEDEVLAKSTKTIINMESQHREALANRRRLARRIAMVSPAAVYQYVGEVIADSGFERQQRFMRSVKDYYRVYEEYVREKVGAVSHTARVGLAISRTVDGKRVRFYARPEEYKGDMSDFPFFTEPEWSITESLRASLSNLLILFLWNALLFVAAHYIFVKRSLR